MARFSKPKDMPDFTNPPVSEVVLSVQFGTLPGFRGVHAGLFWSRIREEYPTVSEQAPLHPTFETFGGTPQQPQIMFETFMAPPRPRYWFEASDGHLLQLQQDRLLHNWRKRPASGDYPRYEALRAKFETEIHLLDKFFREEKLGSIVPNQCEVTYINTITLEDKSNPHVSLNRITSICSVPAESEYKLQLENEIIQARYILSDETPYGRAYVNFMPAFQGADGTPFVQLDITARGKPKENTLASAFERLDQERDAVVRTFAAVTTPQMHNQWGRTDGR
jgi:uncharacterized protein (TIGR04255 family)